MCIQIRSFCDFRSRVNRITPRVFLWGQVSMGTYDKWRVTKLAVEGSKKWVSVAPSAGGFNPIFAGHLRPDTSTLQVPIFLSTKGGQNQLAPRVAARSNENQPND